MLRFAEHDAGICPITSFDFFARVFPALLPLVERRALPGTWHSVIAVRLELEAHFDAWVLSQASISTNPPPKFSMAQA